MVAILDSIPWVSNILKSFFFFFFFFFSFSLLLYGDIVEILRCTLFCHETKSLFDRR